MDGQEFGIEHDEWQQVAPTAALPGRPWWDAMPFYAAPERSGYWQDHCLWPDEVWATDPLPMPVPPGIVLPLALGTWKSGTPSAVVAAPRHQAMPLCLTCLRRRFGTLAEAVAALHELSPARLWHHLPFITGNFEPAHHRGHKILAVRIGHLRGRRSSPDVQHLLQFLKPDLARPVERFHETPLPRNELLAAYLHALFDRRTDAPEATRTPGRVRGLGRRPRGPKRPAGARSRERLTAEAASTSVVETVIKRKPAKKGRHHFFTIEIEGGRNVLDAWLKYLCPTKAETFNTCEPLDPLRALKHDGDGIDPVHLLEHHVSMRREGVMAHRATEFVNEVDDAMPGWLDWQVAHGYLALLAHHDREWEVARAFLADHDDEWEAAWLRAGRYDQTVPVADVLDRLPVSEAARRTIQGDIALLAHDVRERSSLPTEHGSLAELFAQLEKDRYPRLAVTKSNEARARKERILQAIAYELQGAMVTHVDWRPVVRVLAPLYGPVRRQRNDSGSRA